MLSRGSGRLPRQNREAQRERISLEAPPAISALGHGLESTPPQHRVLMQELDSQTHIGQRRYDLPNGVAPLVVDGVIYEGVGVSVCLPIVEAHRLPPLEVG